MDGGHIGLALAAGMLATVNPCGLPMLPVYLSFFISDQDGGQRSDFAAVMRAIGVAGTVSLGFMVVFGAAGAVVSWVTNSVYQVAPWITVVVGVLLIGLGAFLLAGRQLVVALPKLDRGGRTRGLGSMFVFGLSYAIASLSCTLPVFLVQVSSTFGQNVLGGLLLALVFAAGMALVLMALSVSLALARTELINGLRASLRVINRVAGAFLVAAGAYLVYYGKYEIDRKAGPDATVDRVTGWSSSVQSFMSRVGTYQLAGLLVAVIAAVLGVAYLRSTRSGHDDEHRVTEPGDLPAAEQHEPQPS